MELKSGVRWWLLVSAGLLIVPYGIEIVHIRIKQRAVDTFNRTLWN